MDFDPLISRGLLRKITPSKDLTEKELKESEADLQESEKEFRAGGYKWGTIKAYYAMFHAAKALLFLMGLKECSHFAVGEALEVLSKEGKLESIYVNDFKTAKMARENADYYYEYEEKTAKAILGPAQEFVKKMKFLQQKFSKKEQ
ncbi:hypothetical protein COV61_02535 [Candidatus Micrarchaeota archaeon CG11_big_fil_rev_8_21_14_0_20_47_5]|nr:MAG: hypothetical protein AUJ17_04780 [Candidatus Micrarchaeota archaeon CG1_02_47_40]PIN83642.1 MAG: hypothetical protein COV61_02535 [Candidatus Micrarchaeota archaeon CG11_big_fil_rev_8_21_14_0_20_47_5]